MMKNISFLSFFFVFYCAHSQVTDTLMDVGGYKIHFNIVKGKGIPILFESGGGDTGDVWNGLREILKDSIGTTLITYDRAGTGKSEIDTTKISILDQIKGLEIGLKKLGYLKELFMVAHSLGGSYSTLFSSRNKQKIKGCVFIDINLPCFMTEQKTKELREAYLGELPILKKENIGVYYLIKNFEKTNDLVRTIEFPKGIPATVISSDISPFKGADSIQWKSCQLKFGKLKNHSYVLADKSSHYVYNDNPLLVAEEIIKMYNRETEN